MDNRERILFLLLASIGVGGSFGQAALLHNALVHSYPFKMMYMPPAAFYSSVGEAGYYLAILGGLIAIAISYRLPRFLTSTLPVMVCPFVYYVTLEAAYLIQGFSRDQMLQRNFEGYSGNSAKYEFAPEALTLMIVGSIIGATIGFVAMKLVKLRADLKLA
jgi:hypothetical protein